MPDAHLTPENGGSRGAPPSTLGSPHVRNNDRRRYRRIQKEVAPAARVLQQPVRRINSGSKGPLAGEADIIAGQI